MEKVKDTIYRQDAIEAMANTLWHYPNECYRNLNEYEFAKGLAELGLKSVPTAQPERKRGKWLSHYEYCKKHKLLPSGLVVFWWCDQCEQAVEHPTNFCPNCGADMREEQDG